MEDFASYIFSDFHPLETPLESLHHYALYEVADRARNLIAGRSYKEICYTANTVDYMLGCVTELMQPKKGKKKPAIAFPPYLTPTKALASSLTQFDISKQKSLKKAEWHEYFAVLALTLIGDAIRYRTSHPEGENDQKDIHGYLWRCAYSAQEAITYAEMQARELPLIGTDIKPSKKAIKLRKREDAITGHARNDRFKAEFIVLYHSRQWKSRSACADTYMESLKRDGYRMPWVRFNNKRVLLDALRDYGKGELSKRIVKLVDDISANQLA